MNNNMKNRLIKTIIIITLVITATFTTGFLVTQDEHSAYVDEVNAILDSGVSKEELIDFLEKNVPSGKIVDGIKVLREARESGYFENRKNEVTTTTSETPKPTPKAVHEHKYSNELTKNPSCDEAGTLTYTCECGDTYEEVVPKLEHSYTSEVTKGETCITDAEKTYTCTLCGDTYTEAIPAKGHVDGQFKVTKEPTCTEEGEKVTYCKVCQSPIKAEAIPATGHPNTNIVHQEPMNIVDLVVAFFVPGYYKEEVVCTYCLEVLESTVIPVPMWHYILTGGIVLLILVGFIVSKVKKYKKQERK